ncbi:hypothetical protein SDC9_89471 [bioreactor metagenome]|uniref:Uncharacterized protein n=1 Tax=bioreactor metagenome TaxID=1076179 RepID=A0A644ZPC8_9ZZZZ
MESVAEVIDGMDGKNLEDYISIIDKFEQSKEKDAECWSFSMYWSGVPLCHDEDIIEYVRDRRSKTPNQYAKRKYAIFLTHCKLSEAKIISLCEELVPVFEESYRIFNPLDFLDLVDVFETVKATGNHALIDKYVRLITYIVEDLDFERIDNTLIPHIIENLEVFGSEWLMSYLEKTKLLTRCFGMKNIDKEDVKHYEFQRCDCLFPILNELYRNGHLELTEEIIRKNTKTFFRKYWDRQDSDGGLNRFISKIYPLQFNKTTTIDDITKASYHYPQFDENGKELPKPASVRGVEGWQTNIIGKQEQRKILELFPHTVKLEEIPEREGKGKRPDYVITEGDEILIEVYSDPAEPNFNGNNEAVTKNAIEISCNHAKDKGLKWPTKKYKLKSPKYFAAYICHDPGMIMRFHRDIDYLKKIIKENVDESKVDGVLIWLGSIEKGRRREKMMAFSKPGRMPMILNDLVDKHYLE